MPRSRLSRRIIELEDRLGVRLLQRSTRKLTVTEIGQEYYRHCVAMLVEATAAQEAIERSRSGPQGLIRISAPPALVCFEVGAMIARYMAANPRVTVELESTSRRVDVIGEGIDVALRVRFPPLEQSDLVMRTLGESTQRMVASPELVKGMTLPLVPADLGALPSLDLAPLLPKHIWELHGPDGASVRITHKPRLLTDDMAQLLHAALAASASSSCRPWWSTRTLHRAGSSMSRRDGCRGAASCMPYSRRGAACSPLCAALSTSWQPSSSLPAGRAKRQLRVIRVGLADHGDFRSTPVNGHSQDRWACLKSAINGHCRNSVSAPDLLRTLPLEVRSIEGKSARRTRNA